MVPTRRRSYPVKSKKQERRKEALERRLGDVALYRDAVQKGIEARTGGGAVLPLRAVKAKLATAERDVAALRAKLQPADGGTA